MAATTEPLPVSVNVLLGEFAGMLDPLTEVALTAYPDAGSPDLALTKLLTKALRAAAHKLEDLTTIPFFQTRFCTPELATQLSLVQGTDYDEIIQPLSYLKDRWFRQSARTTLAHRPLNQLLNLRLSLSNNAQIADIPLEWVQLNGEKGVFHVLPTGLTSTGLQFQSIYGVGVALRGSIVGEVPMLVHVRYQAGLVVRAAFDPDAIDFDTPWEQELVSAYQEHLKLFAAALLYRPVGACITRGGVTTGMDGLSSQINPAELVQRTKDYQADVSKWAQDLKDSMLGPSIAFL